MGGQSQSWIKPVVQGLLYPAVLGSIFYELLPILFGEPPVRDLLVVASLVLIVVYFSIDYFYTYHYPTYSLFSGLADFVAIVLLWRVFSLIESGNGGQDYDPDVALYMAAIHLLWIIWCLLERAYTFLLTKVIFAGLFVAQFAYDPRIESFVVLQLALAISYAATAALTLRLERKSETVS